MRDARDRRDGLYDDAVTPTAPQRRIAITVTITVHGVVTRSPAPVTHR